MQEENQEEEYIVRASMEQGIMLHNKLRDAMAVGCSMGK
jgi:hypothetical protein